MSFIFHPFIVAYTIYIIKKRKKCEKKAHFFIIILIFRGINFLITLIFSLILCRIVVFCGSCFLVSVIFWSCRYGEPAQFGE